jgi:hypothetical protein
MFESLLDGSELTADLIGVQRATRHARHTCRCSHERLIILALELVDGLGDGAAWVVLARSRFGIKVRVVF